MRSGWTPAIPGASLGRRDPTATGTLDTRVCTASATSSCPAISVSYTANGTIHEPGPGHNSRDGSTNTNTNADTKTWSCQTGRGRPFGNRGADREQFIGSRDSRSPDNAKRCVHHQDCEPRRWASGDLVSRHSASIANVERADDRAEGTGDPKVDIRCWTLSSLLAKTFGVARSAFLSASCLTRIRALPNPALLRGCTALLPVVVFRPLPEFRRTLGPVSFPA
jgi:hypothetical protein